MDEVRLLPRIVLALVLGVALGLERELRRKPAGLRTHALVCMSCATLMAASELLQHDNGSVLGDPVRMSQGILTGIGFIGAGAIVRHGNLVIGITTASTIWMASVVGILAGAGLWVFALTSTVLSLAALGSLDWVIGRFMPNQERGETELEPGQND